MTPASLQTVVEISATPAQVWAVMMDVENWPAWTPSVRGVKRLDHGLLVVGSRVLIRQPKFPPALWKITEIVPGSHFAWRSGMPGMWVTAMHVIVPTPTGSRVTLMLHYQGLLGNLMARITRGISRRYIELEANGLKTHTEKGT